MGFGDDENQDSFDALSRLGGGSSSRRPLDFDDDDRESNRPSASPFGRQSGRSNLFSRPSESDEDEPSGRTFGRSGTQADESESDAPARPFQRASGSTSPFGRSATPFGRSGGTEDKPSTGGGREGGASPFGASRPSSGSGGTFGRSGSTEDKPSTGGGREGGASPFGASRPSSGSGGTFGRSGSTEDKPSTGSGRESGASPFGASRPSSGSGGTFGRSAGTEDKPSTGSGRESGASPFGASRPSPGSGGTFGRSGGTEDKPSTGGGASPFGASRPSSGSGGTFGRSGSTEDKPSTGGGRESGASPFGASRSSSGSGGTFGRSAGTEDKPSTGSGRESGASPFGASRPSSGSGGTFGRSGSTEDKPSTGTRPGDKSAENKDDTSSGGERSLWGSGFRNPFGGKKDKEKDEEAKPAGRAPAGNPDEKKTEGGRLGLFGRRSSSSEVEDKAATQTDEKKEGRTGGGLFGRSKPEASEEKPSEKAPPSRGGFSSQPSASLGAGASARPASPFGASSSGAGTSSSSSSPFGTRPASSAPSAPASPLGGRPGVSSDPNRPFKPGAGTPASPPAKEKPADSKASKPEPKAKPLPSTTNRVKVRKSALTLDQKLDLAGLGLLLVALILASGLLASADSGSFSETLDSLLAQLFGMARFVIPVFLGGVGVWLLLTRFGSSIDIEYFRLAGVGLAFVALATSLQWYSLLFEVFPTYDALDLASQSLWEQGGGGGLVGHTAYIFLARQLGDYGVVAAMGFWWVIALLFAAQTSTDAIAKRVLSLRHALETRRQARQGRQQQKQIAREDKAATKAAEAKAQRASPSGIGKGRTNSPEQDQAKAENAPSSTAGTRAPRSVEAKESAKPASVRRLGEEGQVVVEERAPSSKVSVAGERTSAPPEPAESQAEKPSFLARLRRENKTDKPAPTPVPIETSAESPASLPRSQADAPSEGRHSPVTASEGMDKAKPAGENPPPAEKSGLAPVPTAGDSKGLFGRRSAPSLTGTETSMIVSPEAEQAKPSASRTLLSSVGAALPSLRGKKAEKADKEAEKVAATPAESDTPAADAPKRSPLGIGNIGLGRKTAPAASETDPSAKPEVASAADAPKRSPLRIGNIGLGRKTAPAASETDPSTKPEAASTLANAAIVGGAALAMTATSDVVGAEKPAEPATPTPSSEAPWGKPFVESSRSAEPTAASSSPLDRLGAAESVSSASDSGSLFSRRQAGRGPKPDEETAKPSTSTWGARRPLTSPSPFEDEQDVAEDTRAALSGGASSDNPSTDTPAATRFALLGTGLSKPSPFDEDESGSPDAFRSSLGGTNSEIAPAKPSSEAKPETPARPAFGASLASRPTSKPESESPSAAEAKPETPAHPAFGASLASRPTSKPESESPSAAEAKPETPAHPAFGASLASRPTSKPESESPSAAEAKSETPARPAFGASLASRPTSKPESESPSAAEAKSETPARPAFGASLASRPTSKPESESPSAAEAKPETPARPAFGASLASRPTSKPESENPSEAEAKPETPARPAFGASLASRPTSKPESESPSAAEAKSETPARPAFGASLASRPTSKPESESPSAAEAKSETPARPAFGASLASRPTSKPESEGPSAAEAKPETPARPAFGASLAPRPALGASPAPQTEDESPAAPVLSEVEKIPQAEKPASDWKLPQFADLLEPGVTQKIDQQALLQQARIIEDTLNSFGAPGKVVEVNSGPVITQFGVEPDYIERRGGRTRVKVSAIAALDKDIALALAARTVRIEAPVPGKGYVGIEVPNAKPALVSLRDVMTSEVHQNSVQKSKLTIGLGQGVDGTPISADLAQMPHLLIAGTTGSGKSVCVNAVIACLLLQNTPDELQFIMVDPKRVELTGYNGIPHLVSNVVVDIERIVGVLKWVQREMDERYRKLGERGARSIQDYNRKLPLNLPKMAYLVVVIDELADLMIQAKDETEKLISRLAQMARATGIHLIISTQRPSTDVVTGIIKANLPARIAFAVASSVDSRVILDGPGADRLLGKGDMLFQAPDASAPVRMQGAYLSDPELDRITRYWKEQAILAKRGSTGAFPKPHDLSETVPSAARPAPLPALAGPQALSKDAEDAMFEEAVQLVKASNKASTSLLQRHLRIGYARAARLIDMMEERGIISTSESGTSKPRRVVEGDTFDDDDE